MAATANPTHKHSAVPVFSEGIDFEALTLCGYACAICGDVLVSLVPRVRPELVIGAHSLAA
jgi:hypothetical protein